MMKFSYLNLRTTDAAWNLAAEQYVFDALPNDRSYLMLWQNKNAVIVGKYQNTAVEINAEYVKAHKIQVVRRLSGGGAVYHDLGNLNYSFITDASGSGKIDFQGFCQPVIRILRSFGVPAELNGRNDMTVNGKKFSGNAQYIRKGRVLHHGTILFDSDLEAVGHALHVDAEKLQNKGVASVRSRVTNLRPWFGEEIGLDAFRKALLAEFQRETPGDPYLFTETDRQAIDEIRRQRYACWDWNYGRSPAGSMEKKRRIEGCGTVTASLSVDRGRIQTLSFSGDFFSTLEPDALAEHLIGAKLNEEGLDQALAEWDPGLYLRGMTREKLLRLLLY